MNGTTDDFPTATHHRAMRVVVVVLGDVGRSPRMQQHALAFARAGLGVDLVGLRGQHPGIAGDVPGIRLRLLPALEGGRPGGAFRGAMWAAGRAVMHTLLLSFTLFVRIRKADVVLVQNPPAVPALPLALMFARASRAALIVDWHNLTSAMAALRLAGGKRPLRGWRQVVVRSLSSLEMSIGRRARWNLAVTSGLASRLRNSGLPGVDVLHDDLPARSEPGPLPLREMLHIDPSALLAISSTSWSLDEDFDLLLAALQALEHRGDRLAVVITGTGPRRETFERAVAEAGLRGVHTLWLEERQYRAALAAADVGISLHRSASGLDFPMKIADMFAAGLPVLALDGGNGFPGRVEEGKGIRFFRDARDLARQLSDLGDDRSPLQALRRDIPQWPEWQTSWNAVMQPHLRSLSEVDR